MPTKPGLYFVKGDNRVDPDLGGNGAGKSSLIDLIFFVLYGKTARGLVASNVHTWELTGRTVGRLIFDDDGEEFSIERTWNPNTLSKIDAHGIRTDLSQDQLEDFIKLTYEDSLFACFFTQKGVPFFDLTPAPKAALISSILQLGKYDDFAQIADDDRANKEGLLHDAQVSLQETIGRYEECKSQEFDQKIEDFENKRKATLGELLLEKAEYARAVKSLEDEELRLTKEKDRLTEELDGYAPKISEIKNSIREIDELHTEISNEIAVTNSDLASLKAKLKNFLSLGPVCKTCGQKVEKNHKDGTIKGLENEINSKESQLLELQDTLLAVKQEKKVINTELDEQLDKKGHISSKITEKTTRLRSVSLQKSDNLRSSSQISRRIDSTKDEVNPYVVQKQQQQDKLKALSDCLSRFEHDIVELKKFLEIARFWTKAFKDIKLQEIKDVLLQLEIEINNVLSTLGLANWSISLDVSSFTKGGDLKKGFSVMIKSPANTVFVPWESWSGGEARRLCLAGSLGLANFIMARKGAKLQMEIFDEPTTFLSEAGIQGLVELLSERAHSEGKVILLVDQHKMDSYVFDGVLSVVKTETGSRVTTSY